MCPPMFEYLCETCGYRREELESADSKITRQCVPCGAIMAKQIGVSNFQFKGGGFYINDYGKRKSG